MEVPKTRPTGAEDTPMLDVPLGPGGRDPILTLPRIINFFSDEDSRRCPGWERKYELIMEYLEEAKAACIRGDLGYQSAYVRSLLADALVMASVHKDFDDWTTGPTRWSMKPLAGQRTANRIPTFPDSHIQAAPHKSRYKRRRIHYCPREVTDATPFPALSRGGKPVSDYYILAEERYFDASLKTKGRDPSIVTGFRFDNYMYEQCTSGGMERTRDLIPDTLADEITDITVGDADWSPNVKESDTPATNFGRFSSARGWHRAALQHCLNNFDNHENRVINTPWRRVVFPFLQPLQMPKEIIIQPRALNPEKVPHSCKDPFPWIYHYSQFHELENVLAGWQRRRYNMNNWHDFQRSTLPTNYRGPQIYKGLSVYDDYWLRTGSYLKRLHVLLQDTFGMAPRAFLLAILRDIQAGMSWVSDEEETAANARRDIMRREEVDWTSKHIDVYNQPPSILLLDEADAAWMRYLCEPSRTDKMCDPTQRPADNLAILFDARLQHFLNDPNISGATGLDGLGDLFNPNIDEWTARQSQAQPTVDDVLAYINGGGGKDAAESHGNETYQFSRPEALRYLRFLSGLDRCRYDESSGRVTRPSYTIHPEHRVFWRHENEEEFNESQRTFRQSILNHLVSAYKLDRITSATEDHFYNIFDHLFDNELPRILTGIKLPTSSSSSSIEPLERRIWNERGWIQGSYPEGGRELQRQAPSWSDLASWEMTVGLRGNRDKSELLAVPEKTVQFFRNLAYRMGRTIAHAEAIKRRLQYTTPSNVPGKQGDVTLWNAVSKEVFVSANRWWEQTIFYGLGEIPFKGPRIDRILEKADPDKGFQVMFKDEDTPTIIREGMINDCVANRNTIYPSRITAIEDSSGYYVDDNNYEPNKIFKGLKRPALFKWATSAQRQYQAPFTRRHFFSMRRWPVEHQPEAARQRISARQDETIRVNPSLPGQKYGILTARLPLPQEMRQYAGQRAEEAGLFEPPKTKQPTSASGTKGSGTTKTPEVTKTPQGTKQPEGTNTAPSTNLPKQTTKPPKQTTTQQPPNSTTSEQSTQSLHLPPSPKQSEEKTDNMATATTTRTETETQPQRPAERKLVPITRPTQRFIPGPALFPMAETLLQQVALSHQLEEVLYPRPKPTFLQRLRQKYTNLTAVPTPLVPLLPPTNGYDIPRSNPRKRKIPADFVLSASAKEARKKAATESNSVKATPTGARRPSGRAGDKGPAPPTGSPKTPGPGEEPVFTYGAGPPKTPTRGSTDTSAQQPKTPEMPKQPFSQPSGSQEPSFGMTPPKSNNFEITKPVGGLSRQSTGLSRQPAGLSRRSTGANSHSSSNFVPGPGGTTRGSGIGPSRGSGLGITRYSGLGQGSGLSLPPPLPSPPDIAREPRSQQASQGKHVTFMPGDGDIPHSALPIEEQRARERARLAQLQAHVQPSEKTPWEDQPSPQSPSPEPQPLTTPPVPSRDLPKDMPEGWSYAPTIRRNMIGLLAVILESLRLQDRGDPVWIPNLEQLIAAYKDPLRPRAHPTGVQNVDMLQEANLTLQWYTRMEEGGSGHWVQLGAILPNESAFAFPAPYAGHRTCYRFWIYVPAPNEFQAVVPDWRKEPKPE
ncbi:hypothetical protein F4804DRAFT_183032 [Jackrogersella minutella]|nr:hypothetical protein F4804DRAFT_183032 [Jackrogersella minutella]